MMSQAPSAPLAVCSAPRTAARRRCGPHSHRRRPRFSGQTRVGRYSWARYYHPGLARFISEDPVSFAGGDFNVYAYVRDNPLSFTDPIGLWLCRMDLPGLGDALVDDSVANAVAEFYGWAHSLGVRLKFTSAFRTTEEQRLEFQRNTRATQPGTSLHDAGFAVDISWSSIPPHLRSSIVSAARAAGLDWGGRFSSNYDPYHFYMEVSGGPAKRLKFIERAQQQQSKSQGDIPYCQ